MRTARDGAHALREALRAEGGTLADVLRRSPTPTRVLDQPGPGPGRRRRARAAAAREREYELLLEMILEGSRLHYGEPAVVRPDDPDLALLLGDQLYALGLARLAALGDLEAVAELADVISLVAQAHAAGDGELAAAVWEAGAVAIGWGASAEHASRQGAGPRAAIRAARPRPCVTRRRGAARGRSSSTHRPMRCGRYPVGTRPV